MSNPTNNFSFDLDPYDRLAQMLDGGLFGLLPLPPSWANYVRAQYAPDPSLSRAPASDSLVSTITDVRWRGHDNAGLQTAADHPDRGSRAILTSRTNP